jgi:hypothetical protein
MTRRRFAAAAFVLVAVAPACNGDDDDAAVETSVPATTVPDETQAPPATTEAPTSTSTTVEPTTTALDEEAVKAQIAEDYLAVQQALEDLNRAPTLENLDERLAAIATPGSPIHGELRTAIEHDVAVGERLVPGNPDYSDVFVETVELPEGPSGQTASVTACIVSNESVVGAQGQPIGDPGTLIAARVRDTLELSPTGWRLSGPRERVGIREGLTSCSF